MTSATSEGTFSALTETKAREHQEAGAPEQLPTDVQSIKDTLDNAKLQRGLLVPTNNEKGHFGKSEQGPDAYG